MKHVTCDHCMETFNPFSEGGLTITIATSGGAMQLDFCRKHGEAVLQSLDKYTNGLISMQMKTEKTEKTDNDIKEDEDV